MYLEPEDRYVESALTGKLSFVPLKTILCGWKSTEGTKKIQVYERLRNERSSG